MRYVRDGANKNRITQNLRPASETDPCGFRDSAPSDNDIDLAGRERAIEGLRKAGIPEE